MGISFFARNYFLGNVLPRSVWDDECTMRLSSRIRGEEMAAYLGEKYNPTEGYENDLCIMIKPKNLRRVKKEHWLDFSDSEDYLLEQLRKRPDIRIIAIAQHAYEYFKDNFPNEVVLIPQHHLNWNREKRDRNGITTAGYIGRPGPTSFQVYDKIGHKLNKMGYNFLTCYNFKTRQDAIDFYKKIDFLVVWNINKNHLDYLWGTATKIINAASFGIPSIAKAQNYYKEFEGSYVSVSCLDELFEEAVKFRDENHYRMWSEKAEKASEDFHISRIADLYRALEGGSHA
jgi:hypothetical protein